MAKTRPGSWYRMDNAGVLYSAIQKETYSCTYRFSAVMAEQVDPEALQRAVDRTMPRFPGFRMRIRRGLFWYYYEPNQSPGPFVRPDHADPCQPFRFREDGGWLVRFYYYENRISFEAFHALGDGAGGLTLFRTLLAVYLRELGHDIPAEDGVLDVDEPPEPEEWEDPYARYAATRTVRRKVIRPAAYPNMGTAEPFHTFHVTAGLVSVEGLRERAAAYGASITEYLAAALIRVLLDKQKGENPRRPKPVALAVPIDLRPMFPTRSLRNFILTVRPCIDPALGEYTFEEIIRQVHHYLRAHINRQELLADLTRNVRFQQNRLLQLIPGVIKNPVMALSYRLAAVRPYSTTFTNPGAFRMPPAMAPHIRRMSAILGQGICPRVHCACISCGDTMTITFAGTMKETDTEREFFRFLVREGLHVRVESNRNHDDAVR